MAGRKKVAPSDISLDSVDDQVLVVPEGTLIRVVTPLAPGDKSASTKAGKDTIKAIDKLKFEKAALTVEIDKDRKALDQSIQRKNRTIANAVDKEQSQLIKVRADLDESKVDLAEVRKHREAVKVDVECLIAKYQKIKDNQIVDAQEYDSKCNSMRKEMNAHVLAAKNKIDRYNIDYERLTSKYSKMETDLNEMNKEKARIKSAFDDLKDMDQKSNDKAANLIKQEMELNTKVEYYTEGQKKYREQYREREDIFQAKVAEYSDNLTKLHKEQDALAANWEVFKKEKAKAGVVEKNKKRMT